MAEAVARQDAGDRIEASSAGLAPLGFISEMTKQTLLHYGYSVEGLESKPITKELWAAADMVINMSGRAREKAFREHSKVEDWEIEDPYGDAEVYPRTFEKIRRRVVELAERLRERIPLESGRGGNPQRKKDARGGLRGEGV
jgi:protein-tyrosine-phosphatase